MWFDTSFKRQASFHDLSISSRGGLWSVGPNFDEVSFDFYAAEADKHAVNYVNISSASSHTAKHLISAQRSHA